MENAILPFPFTFLQLIITFQASSQKPETKAYQLRLDQVTFI